MNKNQAMDAVISIVNDATQGQIEITAETELIGSGVIDSMKLVEICLALEDLADENGFEFDWTSDATMSKSRSMFRSVTSLAEEFLDQSKSKI